MKIWTSKLRTEWTVSSWKPKSLSGSFFFFFWILGNFIYFEAIIPASNADQGSQNHDPFKVTLCAYMVYIGLWSGKWVKNGGGLPCITLLFLHFYLMFYVCQALWENSVTPRVEAGWCHVMRLWTGHRDTRGRLSVPPWEVTSHLGGLSFVICKTIACMRRSRRIL